MLALSSRVQAASMRHRGTVTLQCITVVALPSEALRFSNTVNSGRAAPSADQRVDGFEGLAMPVRDRFDEGVWYDNWINRKFRAGARLQASSPDSASRMRHSRKQEMESQEAQLKRTFAMQDETYKNYARKYEASDAQRFEREKQSDFARGQYAWSARETARADGEGRAEAQELKSSSPMPISEAWSHREYAIVGVIFCGLMLIFVSL
jgi:hypothetical protein